MAYETNVGLDCTLLTDIDLVSSQFFFCVLGSDGYVDIATADVRAVGVIQDNPTGTAGTPVRTAVRYGGITKVSCGGTFVPGDLIASDSAGKAVKFTKATVATGTPYIVSGSQVLGVALESGASGRLSTIIFHQSGFSE